MKKTSLKLCACFVSVVLLGCTAFAAEPIWSIGEQDSSYAEFFAAKDHDAVGKKFPSDIQVSFPAGKTAIDTKKDFPWIFPGRDDRWAGSKSHSIIVEFDLGSPPQDDLAGYQLELRGIGHGGAPPLLEIELNGDKRTIQTSPGATGERILNSSDGAVWTSYKCVFLKDSLKDAKNVLTIKNTRGAWFIFDGIQFKGVSGTVGSLQLQSLQGVLRGENNQPTRGVQVNFGDGILGRPATLLCSLDDAPAIEIKLTPKSDLTGVEVKLPVSMEQLSTEQIVKATLKQVGRDGIALEPVVANVKLPAEKKWEVYLVHQTHLDIGYTHLQTDILKRQVQSLRDAIKYIEETKDYPTEARFRFHPEGMWAIDAFLKEATDEEKTAFIRAAQARDIHIDGMYAQAMTGMYNEEELFELFSDATRFCRENNIVLDSVMQTDVPGYTWGLVTAMAQNGIKYMTMGPNPGHRLGDLYHWGDRPFWWVSPSGKEKVLCWLLDTGYHQFHGRPYGHRITEQEIFRLLSGKDTWMPRPNNEEGRKFLFEDLVMIRYGIEGDNGRPNRVLSDVVKEWNEKYLFPKLIISRNSDVMRLLEERYGDKLPVLQGDYTPYWEDGSASTTEATAINRRACEQIVQARALWSMFNPTGYPVAEFDEVWVDLIMYDEHTWGAHNSISAPDSDFVKQQDDYKQEYARRGSREVQSLVTRLAGASSNQYLVVNTLSSDRSGICFIGKTADIAEGASKLRIFKTAVGKLVPVQYIPDPDGKGTFSMYANFGDESVVPALGAIKIEPVSQRATSATQTSLFVNAEKGEIGNDKVRLVIDLESGAVQSLKLSGDSHEFVAADAKTDGSRGLNDYLYIIGRNAGENRETNRGHVKFTVVADGPLVASVLIEAPADSTPNAVAFKRQITIFADSAKVKLENVLDKKMERRPEGTFFGFPFNIPNGRWFVDTPLASVEIEKDQIPGANRNFYCIQRYCSLANEQYGVDWVTVDANMMQLAPILFTGGWFAPETQWRKHFDGERPGGTLYSWVCNNHWETNYKAGQAGLLTLEYWICPFKASFDNGMAQHNARSVHQPLIRLAISDKIGEKPSLLKLKNDKNVLLTGVWPARDGSGSLMARLFNPTSSLQKTTIELSPKYKKVLLSNPFEEKSSAIEGVELAPFETVTVRIE